MVPATAVTGFTTAGTLTVTTATGPVVLSYTGTSTTAGTCGAAHCFTGVGHQSGTGSISSTDTIVQRVPTASSFTGAGVLHATSVTGFTTAGTGALTITTATGPVSATYTGTSTTAGTCGSAACFTGVTVTGGGTGKLSAGGAIHQTDPSVTTFAGSGLIHATSTSGFTATGTITVATSTGTAVVTYTSLGTTTATCGSAACFKGVTKSSGTGIVSLGGAITQALPTVSTYTGSGTLTVASATGFTSPGLVKIATTAGTAFASYTGASGTTITGLTTQGGAHGNVSPSGAVTEVGPGSNGYQAITTLAAASNNTTVATFVAGGGTLNITSATATPFSTTGGTLAVVTSSGDVTLTYTGVSGNSLTGVEATAGATGKLYTGAIVAQATATHIAGAYKVAGTTVTTGYSWHVPANKLSSFNMLIDDSSCENKTGLPTTPVKTPAACPTNANEKTGIDGVYVFVQYTLLVTSTGPITMPGMVAVPTAAHASCTTGSFDIGTCWGSGTSDQRHRAPAFRGPPSTLRLRWPRSMLRPRVLHTPRTNSDGQIHMQRPDGRAHLRDLLHRSRGPDNDLCQGRGSGGKLTTTELVPNEIHTFKLTATNSEGYTSTSYATFLTLANPPAMATQTVNVTSGGSVTVPFNYSGTYPANLATEQIVTPPAHGSVAIQATGKITYHNDNSANATDSFKFKVSDAAGNLSNVETVNVAVHDSVAPTITAVTPPGAGTGSYARHAVVDANYTCADNVTVASCTATQTVTAVPTPVPDGSPIDTSSLIVGNTHSLTITAVDWAGNRTTKKVTYTVRTPAPVATTQTVSTINPTTVLIHTLSHVTSTFPITAGTVTILSPPTYGTVAVGAHSGNITYTPTSASTTAVTHDSFTFTVKDVDGQSSNVGTINVTIYPIPQVSAITPTAGPLTTGTSVTLNGTGLTKVTAVTFGTTPAVSFTVKTSGKIVAVAPPAPGGVTGTRGIRVTAPGGESPTVTGDTYTWDPVPTLAAISPVQGVLGGGGTITVTGTGFTKSRAGQTTVDFGSAPATNVVVNNAGTQLTATIPAGTASGTVNVQVHTPGGATSTSGTADHYLYNYSTPQVSGLSPSAGSPTGRTSVVITGVSFSGATAVKFGASAATTYVVNSNTQITAISPPGTAGTRAAVTVTNPAGTSGTGTTTDLFTYGPAVTRVSPNTGPPAGGTPVTITGAQFTGATAVHFGSASATFHVTSTGTITATSPKVTAGGPVPVTVSGPGGRPARPPAPTNSPTLRRYPRLAA